MRVMRRVVAIGCVMLVACGSEATPEAAFCNEAVPLLSENPDLGELEDAVRVQMEELARIAEVLPADQKGQLQVRMDDLSEQFESDDGWSSQQVVEYVGSLCDRDDLTWTMVTP